MRTSSSKEMTSTAPPKIYAHPSSGSTVLAALQPLLPYSIPLYRRLQFHHRSPSSYILATFPPQPELVNGQRTDNEAPLELPPCFCAIFIDRSRRPETEAWLFLSGEVPGRCSGVASTTPEQSEDSECPHCAASLTVILEHVRTLPVPASAHASAIAASSPSVAQDAEVEKHRHSDAGKNAADYLSHLSDPSIVLFGSVHTVPAMMMLRRGWIRREFLGVEVPYRKFVFDRESSVLGGDLAGQGPGQDSGRGSKQASLPEGLHWGVVRHEYFGLIKSRTAIPRQDATLALLPSVAIFPSPLSSTTSPIAWAFLGLDGSLTTLHVEAAYRGRGLAKTLTAKLCRDRLGEFGYEKIAHADVALENTRSTKVMNALGGRGLWNVYWLRLGLGRSR